MDKSVTTNINPQFRKAFIRCYKKSSVDKVIKGALFYAYIKHEKESDEKKAHFHIVVEWKSPKAKSTIENFDKDDNFSFLAWKSGAVDYLTHKNDKSKLQYSVNDIVSSHPVADLQEVEKKSIAERKYEALGVAIDYIMGNLSFKQVLKLAPQLIYSIGSIVKARELYAYEDDKEKGKKEQGDFWLNEK